MQIFGPWYTFDEALELLQIRASELKYLLQQKAIQPVIYSTQRTWLLHKRSKAGWTGYGLCHYRGAVQAHPEFVAKLLDDENAVIGSGGGILLEPDNITHVTSSYPYTRELPHPPLVAWKTETASPEEIKSCLATPAPEEITPPAYHLKMLAEKLQEQPIVDRFPPIARAEQYTLNFNMGKPFQPSDIRIPKSEIERYQRESRVGLTPFKDTATREHPLHRVFERLIDAHPNAKTKQLWALLKEDHESNSPQFDPDDLIQNIDNLGIEWSRDGGEMRSIKYESFGPTLSSIRKKAK